MSIKVMNYVWEQSRQRGSHLVMLLALADFADDDGVAYPSVPRLAKKARLKDRQAQHVLNDLVCAGELAIVASYGIQTASGWTNRYRVVMADHVVQHSTPHRVEQAVQYSTPGVVQRRQAVQYSTPKPSVNRQVEGGREGTHAPANGASTQPPPDAERGVAAPVIEEPTRAASVPSGTPAPVVQRNVQQAVMHCWQQIFGAPASDHARERTQRVLARWADAHGWAGILATLHYADQQYDDLPTKPNPVKLIGTLMETAKQEGRPYGTNTRDYTKHKEQQHERQRRERTPKQRKHAVAGADHAVQPVRQPDGARPAVAERPAPHFVQRLRERAQANPSG